jgi:hypothetical protein
VEKKLFCLLADEEVLIFEVYKGKKKHFAN